MKFKTIIFAAIVIAGLAGPARAADEAPGSWGFRCQDVKGSKTKQCEIYERLVLRKKEEKSGGQRLAEFAIGYPPENKGKARGVLVLPLGIILDSPSRIQIDDQKALSFHIRYCAPGGCYAYLDLPDAQINQMKNGKKLTLYVQSSGGQKTSIPMSLKNFGPMLDKLTKTKG